MKTTFLIKSIFATLACSIFAICSFQTANGQMEKREDALYRQMKFVAANPRIDGMAPALALKTLDGKPVNLSSYFGKPLIIVKGSYT